MRDKDIINTLKHVESKRQELLTLMFDSRMKNIPIDNIANLVADVLNNLTKCFDYAARDIYDIFIVSNPKKNKLKIYFPFYKNQLMDKNNPFYVLIIQKKDLYDYLYEIAEKSDNKELISNTSIQYSLAREVRELVNADKHNKIIEIDNEGPSELLAKSGLGNIVLKESNPNSDNWKVNLFPNQQKVQKTSKAYRLVENNKEVADFCTFAQWNAEQILYSIYQKYFGLKIKQ